jgi:3-phenylpropionate/trans-cinnamate dioxygenase ferredoxin reductase subunit
MDVSETVLIIGAGQAGAQCAASLRRNGYEGRIVMTGEEAHPPYQRPPLSKGYLLGELESDHLWLQTPETWAEQKVELRTSARAEKIDREAKAVLFADGSREGYDHLVLSTGARVRELPLDGGWLPIRYLRSLDDVDVLRSDFAPGKRIAVIGGGYIGLEAASAAKKSGAEVVVIEAMDRLLARVAAPALSDFYRKAHESRGVEVRLDAMVEGLAKGMLGGVNGLKLKGGESVKCDSVLVGIGVLPNDELASEAGLRTNNGVLVDAQCRTADKSVYAIGDVARQRHWLYDHDLRLESVPNAIEQGKHAAAAIAGVAAPRDEVPWFWSDQFDLKLQSAGLVFGGEETVVRDYGDPNKLALFHFTDGVLTAADAVNDPQAFMAAKMMIAKGARPDAAALADPEAVLKEVMKAALAG